MIGATQTDDAPLSPNLPAGGRSDTAAGRDGSGAAMAAPARRVVNSMAALKLSLGARDVGPAASVSSPSAGGRAAPRRDTGRSDSSAPVSETTGRCASARASMLGYRLHLDPQVAVQPEDVHSDMSRRHAREP